MPAHCDVATKKIYGCKKGSSAWWHEKGHIVFNESGIGSSLQLYQSYTIRFFFSAILCATIVNSFVSRNLLSIGYAFAAAISLFYYFGIDLYEEIWCNAYSKLKMGEK